MLSTHAVMTDPFVREFIDGLPRAYRDAFGSDEVQAHAEVARRRGAAAANVGRFRARRRHEGAAIVVAADDRPGLLALIGAALVLNELDVTHADAYTRRTPAGRLEAVDVFWVRDLSSGGELSEPKLEALRATLVRLIEGRLDPSAAAPRAGSQPSRISGTEQQTCVRFIEGGEGQLSVLEVETFDRSGLLLSLARALFEQRVQIVRSEVHTRGSLVRDRFTILEIDGRPIQPGRRLEIQVAVLSAIEPAAARTARA